MKLNKSEREELTGMYVVANTAPYLYRRMVKSSAVQRMAESEPASALASFYRRIGRKKKRQVNEVAIAYAALIALTQKQPPSNPALIESLKSVDMDFGPAIISITQSDPASATAVEISLAPQVAKRRQRQSVSASTHHRSLTPLAVTTR